jgi:hypothetical protein
MPPPDQQGKSHSIPHEHVVQFYENDSFLSECVAAFASGAWQRGDPVLLIATHAHRKTFERAFKARGFDLRSLASSGLLTWHDVRSTLRLIMTDGMPDETLVGQHLGALIEAGTRDFRARSIHAYSELVDVLWRTGNGAPAIRLEELWNPVIEKYDCSLLCAYDLRHLDRASDAAGLVDICRRHSRAVPTESYREDSTPDERQRSVLALQQRARALESEKRQHKALEHWLRRTLAARRTAERARAAAEVLAARAGRQRLAPADQQARAHLSHDLKTPLNTILGWTQMIAAGHADERTLRHAIEVIGRNAHALNALIDGLIDPHKRPVASTR